MEQDGKEPVRTMKKRLFEAGDNVNEVTSQIVFIRSSELSWAGGFGTAGLSTLSSIFMWVLLTIVGSYFVASSLSSIHIALREKDFRLLFLLLLAFPTRHVAYGLGSLYGVVKVLGSKLFWKGLLTNS